MMIVIHTANLPEFAVTAVEVDGVMRIMINTNCTSNMCICSTV